MKFKEFQKALPLSVFTTTQAKKIYSGGQEELLIQLFRWAKRGELVRLKQGLYQFSDRLVDEFTLAGYLYSPSYISLETALNNQGIISDVSLNVTSVSLTTTKIIKTVRGNFLYSKIQRPLFFGWQAVKDAGGFPYQIALPEKALLDWIYLRKIKDFVDQRVGWSELNQQKLKKFSQSYPGWVKEVVYEQLNR